MENKFKIIDFWVFSLLMPLATVKFRLQYIHDLATFLSNLGLQNAIFGLQNAIFFGLELDFESQNVRVQVWVWKWTWTRGRVRVPVYAYKNLCCTEAQIILYFTQQYIATFLSIHICK